MLVQFGMANTYINTYKRGTEYVIEAEKRKVRHLKT